MYESPINRICSEITHQVSIDEENKAMLEVRKVLGYDINKSELIKALRYDRNQYEKGFRDGLEYKATWMPLPDPYVAESEEKMNRYIITFYKSDEDIPTLVVMNESSVIYPFDQAIDIVKIITGDKAVRIFEELTKKEETDEN